MPDRSARELAELYTRALNARDWAALEPLLHSDYYTDFPQSGERIRGFANIRAMFENYPGGLRLAGAEPVAVVGAEERWVVAPNFSMIRVTGSAETFTTVTRATYPDGSKWFVVALVQADGGRMRSATTYFAPDFPAPEWRAPLTERIPGWGN